MCSKHSNTTMIKYDYECEHAISMKLEITFFAITFQTDAMLNFIPNCIILKNMVNKKKTLIIICYKNTMQTQSSTPSLSAMQITSMSLLRVMPSVSFLPCLPLLYF